jgi:hypothetical protein
LIGELCTWCGSEVEADDGFRAYEPVGERRAVFCRLEHVVPWAIQGPHWEAGGMPGSANVGRDELTCSHCGQLLGEVHVLLIRHRGEARVPDGFCSVAHLREWAKAGGRWQ